MTIKCILYDLDGTLADCADWHYHALNKTLKDLYDFEITYEEHLKTFNGIPTKKKLELLLNQNRIKERDLKLISDKKQTYTIETIESLAKPDYKKIQLHKYTKFNKIVSACVSNSVVNTITSILHYTGQLEYFAPNVFGNNHPANISTSKLIHDGINHNNIIQKPKPSPECYINAMIQLRAFPSECIIVEDSPVGIQAAKGSCAHVWEVKNADEVNLENLKIFMKQNNLTTSLENK